EVEIARLVGALSSAVEARLVLAEPPSSPFGTPLLDALPPLRRDRFTLRKRDARRAEVLEAGQRVRPAGVDELDARPFFAAADDRQLPRIGDGGEQLVVLAEAEVVEHRAVGERYAVELDHDPAAGALGDVPGIGRDPVGEVEHRVRVRREPAALREAQRRPRVAAPAEGGAGPS